MAILCHAAASQQPEDPLAVLGHSQHGEAFDEGPRQRPWKMEGIGHTHLPITTRVPEVQEWFDQGNTLLHSFWYFEAERAFRWCLKLDPECAMAYWGLARAVMRGEQERADPILREAVARKDQVNDLERGLIEAWAKVFLPDRDGRRASGREMSSEPLARELELLLLEHRDSVELKALFVLASLYHSSRIGNEMVLGDLLEQAPEHPGAHHYRIHNWDGPEGAEALESCEQYGRIAWYSGHANHMPGHIYSGTGMWHEGAYWMDRATRVEKDYMRQRMTLPFNAWNYAHNRNYLAFTQEQLGLPSLALQGARDLIAAPLDPKYNNPDKPGYWVFREGMAILLRTLVQFERWEDILAEGTIPWRDTTEDRMWRHYAEGLARLALGERLEVEQHLRELKELEKSMAEAEGERARRYFEIAWRELESLIVLEEGEDVLGGLRLLTEAAEKELKLRETDNDPPDYPRSVYVVLGEEYLRRQSPELARHAFERVLEQVRNEPFALAGLARAWAALGDEERARHAHGRLLFVWSECEPGLRWLRECEELGLASDPIDLSPRVQRNYRTETLAELGPNTWQPYDAPELHAADSLEQPVTLEDYRGQNVLLVFFLGEECPHCMDQLLALHERAAEFAERDTALLAISGDSPEQVKASERMGALDLRLLSDPQHENARRFRSFDDFEEIELHSTILIDRAGKLRWARTGGDPFMELDFLLAEIDRLNGSQDDAAPATGS